MITNFHNCSECFRRFSFLSLTDDWARVKIKCNDCFLEGEK